jgi:signal transduction histidine kinase
VTATALDRPRGPGVRLPVGLAGAAAAVAGIVVLYGWVSHTRHLVQLRPGQVPVQFNTALCLALLGIALTLLPTRWFRWAVVPAAFVALWAVLTLTEYLAHRDLGIDQLLFRSWLTLGVDVPGRMARNSAACFLLLGTAVLVLAGTGRRGGRPALLAGVAASTVAGLALVALFGYAGGVSTAYTWRTSTAMAPLTAGCLVVLAVGYVAAAWEAAGGGASPHWLPVPVGVGALAATLFLWDALVSLGAGSDRTISVDRAAGVVLAIGLVFSALLALATALGQAALRRRRVAERLTRQLETEGARRAAVQDTLLRRALRDAVLRNAYAAASSATELEAGFAAFAQAVSEVLAPERTMLAVVDDRAAKVVAVAGPAGVAAPVGTVTPLSDPLLGEIVRGRRPYLMRDVRERFADSAVARSGVRSFVTGPVIVGGEVRATLGFASSRPDAFGDEDVELVDELINVVGGALFTLARLHDERVTTARLRELDALKNEFVGVVAHDLRSPMTVIVGYIETVLTRWDDIPDDTKRELLSVASRNTRRLSDLVEDVLQVARIESGDFPYDIKPFDLGALVRRTAAEMTAAQPDRPVVAEAPSGLPAALGDEDRQWRVLTNLLANAQKYSPPDVPAVVCVAADASFLRVSVADRGPGIPAEDMPRLFGKFSRLAPPKGGASGTGLGLYICKALVEAQGGTIEAESTVGAGTTMRYTVPRTGEPR